MTPQEARRISSKVDRFEHQLQAALGRIKWAAEQGFNHAELLNNNCYEIRTKLKSLGFKVKWSWRHIDHIVMW